MALALEIDERPELTATDLDPETHAEMLMLYRESADSIRFAKAQQWKSLGATLLVYAVILFLAWYNTVDTLLIRTLLAISLALGCGTVYTLAIYQIWQNTERQKLRAITERLSSLARDVRAVQSRAEANFFRYMLLTFMVVALVAGNAVVILQLRKYLFL